MSISKVFISSLFGLALGATAALAENGVLVVHVIDIHQRPVIGVSLRAGSGSSVERVDSFGEARIRLAADSHPGDPVFLELVAVPSNRDLVFISPLNRSTAVPSFDDKPSNFVEVTLVKRGDRSMLENGYAARAMASDVVHGPVAGQKSISNEEALKQVAQKYGRTPEEVDLAIRTWSKEAKDHYEIGLAAMYAQKYPEAEQSLRDSLEEQKKVEKKARVKISESAALLGQVCRIEGKLSDALAAYKEAVEYSPDNGAYLFSLAAVQLDLENPADAERLADLALKLDLQRYSEGDSDLAESYYRLGAIYVNQAKYDQGEIPFRKALKSAEQGFGPDNPLIVSYLDNLAIVCSRTGKMLEAESLIQRAQAIEKISLSPDDPETASTASKLASFYMAEGRYRDAEPLLTQSMATLHRYFAANATKAFPPDFGLEALETLDTLEVNRQLRGYANQEDLALLQESLMFQRALSGEQSVKVAGRHEQVADLLRRQGRYQEAEPEYRQALEIRKTQMTPATLNLEAKLSYNLAQQGRRAEANEVAKASLTSAKAHFPINALLAVYNHLADLYSLEQDEAVAESTLREALAEPLTSPVYLEQERVEANNRLVIIYLSQGKFTEARAQLMTMNAALQKDSPSIAHILLKENLAVLSIKQLQCSEAKLLLDDAFSEAAKLTTNSWNVQNDVREKQITRDAECRELALAERDAARFINEARAKKPTSKKFELTMIGHLGDIYTIGGKYAEAEQQFDQGITLAKTMQDATVEDVAGFFARKADMYMQSKRYPEASGASAEALATLDEALWKTDPGLQGIIELRTKTCRLNHEGSKCNEIEARLSDFKPPIPLK